MAHVRKGDMVVVTKGKYKGKKGAILRIVGQRVVVDKINMVKRHSKPSQTNQQGGIIEKEGTIAIANVALWDDKAGKGVRSKAGSDNGKKVRVSVKTGTKFVVNP